MNICCVCNKEKFKKNLVEISEQIEILIREHIYNGYSKEIAVHPDSICTGCKSNLYLLGQGKEARGKWLREVKQVNALKFFMCCIHLDKVYLCQR